MGSLVSGPKMPDPLPPPPPPPEPPQAAPPAESPEGRAAREAERRRRRAATGPRSTILTGPGGLGTTAPTTNKTLLGQ